MKILQLLLLLYSSINLMGCKEFITIDAPKKLVLFNEVFSDESQATAALTGIYSRMITGTSNPYLFSLVTGVSADELTNYSNDAALVQLYQNSPRTDGATSNNFWVNGYNYIYQANAIWEGCQNSDHLNPEVKKQLQAEAVFIRAFWYSYLVNFYGDVPLLLTTDYKGNGVRSKAPKAEVYNQIITDLGYAIANLNPGYVDRTSKNTYAERVRPNRYTAQALLSRVYLYHEEWEKAKSSATEVIEFETLYDTVPINQAFLKNNKEAIWQLQMPTNTVNNTTPEASSFILTAKPISSTAINTCTTISLELLAAFEPNDLRLRNWISQFNDASVTPNKVYYFPFKYKQRNSVTPTEYSTVFRLAEQYLIRAEALIRLKDPNGALNDLNIVRERAGLTNILDQNEETLLKAVLHERQVELFAEWGHRWLDLKRTGQIEYVMGLVTPLKGGTSWESAKQWWPIPKTEVDNNPNLTQNFNYN